MKNLLLLLSLLLGQPMFCQAQRLGDYLNNLVAPLDKTEITSGFLWDKGTNGFVEPAIYDGTLRDSVYLQPATFGFLYIQARNAYIGTNTNPLPLPDAYMDYVKRYTGTDTIPLAALALRYNRIHQNAVDSNLLFLQSDQLFDVQNRTQSPYWQDTLFAFAPLKTDAWHNTVHFTLPNDLVWQNLGWSSPLLQADFADGQGWQTLAMGQTYTIQYDSGGVKTILTRIQQGGTTLKGQSIIFVAEETAQERGEGPNYTLEEPEDIIPIPGGGGDLRIFYGSPCDKLLKPFILVEGFELQDNPAQFTDRLKDLLRKTSVITNSPTLPLGEWLYSQGYDIVWVNLANVQGYIQDNAEIVKAAVQKINEIKAANGSSEPNMIMGVSAGGIITKYMFAKTNSVPFDHQCEKFFSYDSPLSGANIPVSVQCLLQHINYIASEQGQNLLEGTPGLQPAFNALVSPFAQQTLLYRFYYPSGSNAGVLNGDTHYAFMAEMNALGPVPIRHIALANGSPAISERANISPGSHFFKVLTGGNGFAWTFPPGIPVFVNVNFEANGYAIPSQVNNLIYDGNLKIVVNGFLVKEYPEEVSSPESGKTYDTAPGSSSNLVIEALNAIDGTIVPNISYSGFPLANGEITVSLSPVHVSIYATHYCFIPTRSAISAGSDLSVNGPFNCSQGSSDRCTMNNIPTNLPASWGVSEPEENQDHVFLDARIGDVIVDEVDVANLIPGGSIPTSLNVYYNVGLPIQSGIPTVTISSTNGKLSVNNTGNVAYATGNEPVSPLTLLKAYTKCEAIVTVENGASLVVGADGSVKNGVLTVTESSIVHIKSGGILRVTGDQSSLIIKSGATLILDPGANVILESNGANIRIEGELVINGNFNFSGTGHFVFAQGNQLTFGPNHNTFYLDGIGINQRYVRLEAPLRISDGHRLLWTDGLVEIIDGNLDFTTGAGADFERVTFSGGGEAIIAQQASAINLLSCVATGVKYPIQGDQSFGLYVDQCQFDAYSKGITWQNSAFFNVVRSSFVG